MNDYTLILILFIYLFIYLVSYYSYIVIPTIRAFDFNFFVQQI